MSTFLYLSTIIVGLLNQILATEVYHCNSTVSCPEKYPCCSRSGVCGTGAYCLGNCDPRYSYSLKSCMPDPICKDVNTVFSNYSSKILNGDTYLGNASEANWTYTGYILDYPSEEALILAMPKYSGGTLLSSTHALWYGKVSAKLKTSHLAGVITSFILFSGVQDEIDFEWVGSDLETTQTNFYWNGVLNWTNSANISNTNTFDDYHTYEIDWQEDYIKWSVDGVVGRTLYKNETYNSTTGIYQFPQTPSKVDISLWPGGNATNSIGTIEWAGGEINWDASDLTNPGYYYAILKEVNITCGSIPSGTKQNGTEAYVYTSHHEYLQQDIAIVNERTYLDSLEASGNDPDAGASSSSSSSSSTSRSSSSSASSSSTSKDKNKKSKNASKSDSTTNESTSTTIAYTPAASTVATSIQVTYVTEDLSSDGISSSSVNKKISSGNYGHINRESYLTILITCILNILLV